MTKAPEEIHWVRSTQLSIARFYGGCKFNGHHYVYQPVCAVHGVECDVLVRGDMMKKRAKDASTAKKTAKVKQPTLL